MNDKIMTPEEIAEREEQRLRRQGNAADMASQHNLYNPSAKGGIYSLEQAIASSEPPYLRSVDAYNSRKEEFNDNDDSNATSDSKVNKVVGELPEGDIVNRIDPNIVESPKEVVHKAKEAQAYADLVSSLYSQADYEADEKKKKAAQWITAAQMLGDSIAALGNSYFTAKGANNMGASQGAAKAAEAAGKLEMDIRNARERAAKTRYELEKARKEWEYRVEQDELARQERKEAAARAQANADRLFEYNKEKDAQSRLDTQAQREIENARAEKLLKIQEKNADSTAKRADAYAKRQAWLNAGGGTSKNWNTPISIKDENGKDVVGYINTKGLTETSLQQIADTLPNDVKEKYGLTGEVWRDSQVLGTFDDKVARAIGEVIQDTNSETYKYMYRLGLIEVGTTMPSSDKQEGGGKSLGLENVNR